LPVLQVGRRHAGAPGNPNRQNLLFDADDTLWENNIYFERVIGKAQDMLQPFGVGPDEFRARLNETELRHIPVYGYGTLNFTRSLVETFENYLPAFAEPSWTGRIRKLAVGIMNEPIELLPGVEETLEYLHGRHFLFLITKGDQAEQGAKIEASGLGRFFREIEIVPDKNAAVFRELMQVHGWEPRRTWMIGNSRRSDIHPALEAGINAVFIPHEHTWVLEHEDPVDHWQLLELNSFSDLRSHF
jgi:putative hydrolase of the HAD superfamily